LEVHVGRNGLGGGGGRGGGDVELRVRGGGRLFGPGLVRGRRGAGARHAGGRLPRRRRARGRAGRTRQRGGDRRRARDLGRSEARACVAQDLERAGRFRRQPIGDDLIERRGLPGRLAAAPPAPPAPPGGPPPLALP